MKHASTRCTKQQAFFKNKTQKQMYFHAKTPGCVASQSDPLVLFHQGKLPHILHICENDLHLWLCILTSLFCTWNHFKKCELTVCQHVFLEVVSLKKPPATNLTRLVHSVTHMLCNACRSIYKSSTWLAGTGAKEEDQEKEALHTISVYVRLH